MLSLLIFFTELPVLLAVVGNVLIHEWGHIYTLHKFGVYIRKVYVGLTGLRIQCNLDYLSKRANFLCAAAGPMIGLFSSVVASFCGNIADNEFLLLFAGTGLILSLFNLLPVNPLDGWRMVFTISPGAAYILGDVCAFMVLCIGIYVMAAGYGTALACMGIFFMVRTRRNPIW